VRVQAVCIAKIAEYLQLDEPGRSSSWLERFRWAERCIKALGSSEVSREEQLLSVSELSAALVSYVHSLVQQVGGSSGPTGAVARQHAQGEQAAGAGTCAQEH
jgi:hypothetical protein